MIRPSLPCLLLLAACLPHEPGLTRAEQFEIRQYVPSADLSHLTPAQVSALSSALHHGDGFDIPAQVRSILMW